MPALEVLEGTRNVGDNTKHHTAATKMILHYDRQWYHPLNLDRSPYVGKTTAVATAVTTSTVCSIFMTQRQRYCCQSLGFFTRVQMLVHAIAQGLHEGSAWKMDSGTKISCLTQESNLRKYCAWLTDVVDHFYTVLFSTLEQTHCTRILYEWLVC